ncbi:prepilin-type N-terminal cleavage/methylation domain-containing protein [Bacillus sp. REN16]|uniref:prepilin-type N-terminal cleavage/methylation domain-containing protein n=1 Tax=Bacillus sp. REN16 TaxID=2887296 RepID=UPI001E62FCB2|nr:prepilin-type N-terminal cleavage/methylation domain-containing protein [Bacillus sp. REN16]MCC3356544.1 prepilin-type N-terminal cleavage/methylation domain-containing protein [Bacillus sp. REN16]
MVRNNKGVTLIELLAVLALLTLILTLATSVHLFGQRQTSNQTSQIENQANVRLAINILTREIRKANSVEVSNNVLNIDGTIYKLENNAITKKGSALVSSIKDLQVIKNKNKIQIDITSISDKNDQEVTLSTKIYIRE